jgi:hypothetical protein
MKPEDFRILLHTIDQMIQISEPSRAEYYRGYRLGIQFLQLGILEESIHEHYRLNESYAATGDDYIDSYARGYRDGCKGLKPEP